MIAILANLRSMHNVGSIFRTADAAGIEKLYLAGITPAPLDRFGKIRPQLAKVSLGAEKTVAWEYFRSVPLLLKRLKKAGYKIFAIEQSPKSIPYYRTIAGGQLSKIALMVGNEIKGIPPAILKMCDKVLEIPMRRAFVKSKSHPRYQNDRNYGKESLNVSVAFAIVAFSLLYSKR